MHWMKHLMYGLCIATTTTVCIEQHNNTLSTDTTELFKKGITHFNNNEYNDALEVFTHIADKYPHYANVHFNIALVHIAQDKLDDALASLEKTITYDPKHASAYAMMGTIWYRKKDFGQAVSFYKKAAAQEPNNLNLLVKTARILYENDRIEESYAYCMKGYTIPSDNLHDLMQLANMTVILGRSDKAIECFNLAEKLYNKIITATPHNWSAHLNVAHVLRYQGHMQAALDHYHALLPHKPDNYDALYGIAEAYLTQGNFKEGWKYFDARWKRIPSTKDTFVHNLWNGTDSIKGKRVLIRAEFGLGDTIQFYRYLKNLKEKGATVILEVQYVLMQLLNLHPYIDEMIPCNPDRIVTIDFDFQIPLMGLAAIFSPEETAIPNQTPYLHAKPELTQHWKNKIAHDTNFKIGICWQGSRYYAGLRTPLSGKSIPLSLFEPLMRMDGVSVYSLQKVNGEEEINTLSADVILHTFDDFDTKHGRFMDTTALIENLDMVLTVDTSIAHVAGALGKKTWVMLPYVADWRWMTERTDTPWYPTMQLFRQTEPGNWQTVMSDVMITLAKEIDQTKQAPTNTNQTHVATEVSIGELVDKITILKIKTKEINDEKKLENISRELDTLTNTYTKHVEPSSMMDHLETDLMAANYQLWQIEDAIRDKERDKQFDNEFVTLARSVYFNNDERCRIKRMINDVLGSYLQEEKSYAAY